MSKGNTVRTVGIPIALILVGFGLSFLLLESVLRAIGYDPMGEIAEGRSLILRPSDDPLRQYEFTPNSSGFAWRTRVEINSYGMRDREYPVERTGAPRIVAIGDSVTFGSGVVAEDRYTEQLEAALQKRTGGPVEVLNLGVGGYDTLQEVATLEHVGLAFSPDLVIVGYCVNDLGDNSPNLQYIQQLQGPRSPLYELRVTQLLSTITDKLQLIWRLSARNRDHRFAERYRGFIEPVSDDKTLMALRQQLEEHLEDSDDADFRLSWYQSPVHLGKLAYSLTRLSRLGEEHGFETIVAIIPYLGESASYEIAYRMVEHMAEERGLHPVVLGPSLAAEGFENLRSRSRDVIHPNALGHRLIAEALAPIVLEKLRASQPRGADSAGPARL